MTPHQKLKYLALITFDSELLVTEKNVDKLFDLYYDDLQDILYDMRGGDVETELPCEYSRHYESYSVAVKTPDGSYVGWTYWYGGGKHSEPEAEPWMNKAYNLSCTEEQKLVTIQTFTKVDQ